MIIVSIDLNKNTFNLNPTNRLKIVIIKLLYLIDSVIILQLALIYIPTSSMNPSQNNDTFSMVKTQILKQKHECVTICLKQTQKRVADAKKRTQQLRQTLALKEQQNFNLQNYAELQIEEDLEKYHEEERNKLQQLDQLKRIIQQYKFLCGESIKYQSTHSQHHYRSERTQSFHPPIEQSRENSFLNNLDSSAIEPHNNLSMVRNKSYTKVKTTIHCQQCERDYKPNEYFRHMQDHHPSDYADQLPMSTNRTKDSNHWGNGYNTMRN